MRRAVALLVTAGLVVGGLIGGDVIASGASPEEEIEAVEEVALGYGLSDGAEACQFMSASALDQLGGESGCARRFETVGPAEFEVQEVTMDVEEAVALVENTESQEVIELGFVKEGDEWKLSSFPGLETLQPPGEPPAGIPEDLVPPAPQNVPGQPPPGQGDAAP